MKRNQAPPTGFKLSEEWLNAFQSQYHGVLSALAYADSRAAGVGVSAKHQDGFPHRLVLWALTETLLGTLRWDPDKQPLLEHIKAALRRRTEVDWSRATDGRRGKKFRHLSIDATTAAGRSRVLAEAERVMQARADDARIAQENAQEGLAQLRQHLGEDPAYAAYLRARKQGATTRAEILRLSGLSAADYANLLRRIGRIRRQLSIQAVPTRTKENDHGPE